MIYVYCKMGVPLDYRIELLCSGTGGGVFMFGLDEVK